MSVALVGVLVAAVGGVLAVGGAASDDGDSPAAGRATAEATVRDLTRTQTLSGVIAHRDLRELVPAKAGTLTWLPAVGDDLTSGQVLMRVDEQPVVLLSGAVPAWRELHAGVPDGPDVAQLETALLQLGHGVASATYPDGHWDSRTTEAVNGLQAAVGATVDGSLSLGEVVFTVGAVHVAKLDVPLGGPAATDQAVMTVQSTDRVVLLDLNPLDKDLVVQGAPVAVELPSGEKVPGSIESVSTTLEMNADNQSVFKVKVGLADPKAAADLDLAPVTVKYPTTVASAVLSVPVTAIIGIPGGGHAVDVVEGGSSGGGAAANDTTANDTTANGGPENGGAGHGNGGADGEGRRVPVVLGAWGDGFVQVTGDLDTGELVEVPS